MALVLLLGLQQGVIMLSELTNKKTTISKTNLKNKNQETALSFRCLSIGPTKRMIFTYDKGQILYRIV